MISADDIMSEHVVVIHEDMTIKQVAHLMLRDGVSGFPVVCKDSDTIVGIITLTDLFRIINQAAVDHNVEEFYKKLPLFKDMKVSEMMSRRVVSIKPETKLPEIIQLLLDDNIHTFPVLADDGKILGIVSKHDILNAVFAFE